MLLPLLLAACLKPGVYPLDPPAPVERGRLQVSAQASVDYSAAHGSTMTVDLDLAWSGQVPARIDLARSLVRADGLPWEPCHHDEDIDLFITLQPGERATPRMICRDIPRPQQTMDFRFFASGTSERGVIDLRFGGLR